MFAVSFVVATGIFGARMLTSPPVTEAATIAGINVAQIEVPKNLSSSFVARHDPGDEKGRHPRMLACGAGLHHLVNRTE